MCRRLRESLAGASVEEERCVSWRVVTDAADPASRMERVATAQTRVLPMSEHRTYCSTGSMAIVQPEGACDTPCAYLNTHIVTALAPDSASKESVVRSCSVIC